MHLRRALPFAAAVVLFWQLFLPPVPGIADNGDFGKLIARFHMGSGATFTHANTKFFFGDQYSYHSGFNSSELGPIYAALAVNRLISRDSFDLRVLGAIHASLFLLAVVLVAPLLESAALGVLALVLFCDFMYAGFLNSFYPEPAAFLFLLLAVVFYLRAVERRRTADAVALFVCILLTITASSHYSILGPWFALLFWCARGVLWDGRRLPALAASFAILVVSWVAFRFLAPEHYRPINPFNVIFSQILPNTPDADHALTELGLDASYKRWIGLQAYSPEVPMGDPAFYQPFAQRTGYGKIARFYLRHPRDAWLALLTSLDEAGSFQSPLGNFDASAGMPLHYGGLHVSSGFNRTLFYHRGGLLFGVFMALSIAVSVWLLRVRHKLPEGAAAGGVILAAMSVSSLLISSLADVYDQFRHQVVTFALFDLLLLILTTMMLRHIRLRRSTWRPA